MKAEDLHDLKPIKAKYGVPDELQACHTGVIGGYVVEGHVPADVIVRLLEEHPKIEGLAVPGMPLGSPGMESPGQPPQRYNVYTFAQKRKTGVFATR